MNIFYLLLGIYLLPLTLISLIGFDYVLTAKGVVLDSIMEGLVLPLIGMLLVAFPIQLIFIGLTTGREKDDSSS